MSTKNSKNDLISAKMDQYRGITIKNMDILPKNEQEFEQILLQSLD